MTIKSLAVPWGVSRARSRDSASESDRGRFRPLLGKEVQHDFGSTENDWADKQTYRAKQDDPTENTHDDDRHVDRPAPADEGGSKVDVRDTD